MKVAGARVGSSCFLPPILLLLLLCWADHAVIFSACEYGTGRPYILHGRQRFSSPSSRTIAAAVVRGDAAGKGVDDEGLAAEKRRVYTGPNPLHNR
ncbi:hypothetical protein SAY86_025289 [Trapa natans]|uniref:Uncharacterized protein n=1 Tax=Trapa natans TaxID=22666 RepID=A0AAN7RC84_TRANT|nr:hypothetical protein SAY86_025289 [Trapa natans]